MDGEERIANVLLVKRLLDGAPVDGRDITEKDLEKVAATDDEVLEAKLAACGLLGQVAAHAYADEWCHLSAVLGSKT